MTDHMPPAPDHVDDEPDRTEDGATPAQLETADAVESAAALEGAPSAGGSAGIEVDVESTGEPVDTRTAVSPGAEQEPESQPEPETQSEPEPKTDPEPEPESVPETPSEAEPEPQPEADTSTVSAPEPEPAAPATEPAAETDAVAPPAAGIERPGFDEAAVVSENGVPVEASVEVAPASPDDPARAADLYTQATPDDPEPSQQAAPTPAETPDAVADATPPTAAPTAPPHPSPIAPKPSALPRRPVPTPSALSATHPSGAAGVVAPPVITTDHSASAAFGRVDDDGVVFVRTPDGEERQVGSYPGAAPEQALTYFARKYDELFASAGLLEARLQQPEVASKDVQDALKTLTSQVTDAAVVGDLDALATKLDAIRSEIAAKRVVEQQQRALARTQAKTEREAIVAEAESIAGQPESRIQWKTSGARMRELLDSWKAHQRAGVRLDRESESALWQRFSAARNRFDKARRTHFAGLDAAHADAKGAKESLVTQAETLATSKEWAPTAGAFKRLMDDWRSAGRASRSDDDRLWARFKAAQDSFFAAKDAVVAAEEEGFRGNLSVKEALLKEAEAILPVTDLEKAKGQLRAVQDRWDAAGKVPRGDLERVEKAMRRIEQTVRDADEKRWASSNPEAAARATAMAEQLERAVAGLEKDLAAAQRSDDAAKIEKAQGALDARRAWLAQARAGVAEFGG